MAYAETGRSAGCGIDVSIVLSPFAKQALTMHEYLEHGYPSSATVDVVA
jgi:hypothetical protein